MEEVAGCGVHREHADNALDGGTDSYRGGPRGARHTAVVSSERLLWGQRTPHRTTDWRGPAGAVGVGEPEGRAGSGRDPPRPGNAGAAVVADRPGGGDAPDRVVPCVGEPQRAVGPGRDPRRPGNAGAAVVADRPGGGNAP